MLLVWQARPFLEFSGKCVKICSGIAMPAISGWHSFWAATITSLFLLLLQLCSDNPANNNLKQKDVCCGEKPISQLWHTESLIFHISGHGFITPKCLSTWSYYPYKFVGITHTIYIFTGKCFCNTASEYSTSIFLQ